MTRHLWRTGFIISSGLLTVSGAVQGKITLLVKMCITHVRTVSWERGITCRRCFISEVSQAKKLGNGRPGPWQARPRRRWESEDLLLLQDLMYRQRSKPWSFRYFCVGRNLSLPSYFSFPWMNFGCCQLLRQHNSKITVMAAPYAMIAWLLFSHSVVSPAEPLYSPEFILQKPIALPVPCGVCPRPGTEMLVLALMDWAVKEKWNLAGFAICTDSGSLRWVHHPSTFTGTVLKKGTAAAAAAAL